MGDILQIAREASKIHRPKWINKELDLTDDEAQELILAFVNGEISMRGIQEALAAGGIKKARNNIYSYLTTRLLRLVRQGRLVLSVRKE